MQWQLYLSFIYNAEWPQHNWSCQKHVPAAVVLAFNPPSPGSNTLITISLAVYFMRPYFTAACRTFDLQNITYLPNIPLFTVDFVSKHRLLSKRPDCSLDGILRNVHQLPEWLYKQRIFYVSSNDAVYCSDFIALHQQWNKTANDVFWDNTHSGIHYIHIMLCHRTHVN